MAISRSPGQFRRRLTVIGRSIVSEAGKAIRKAALAADQAAVLATPVDTGRARANWIVTTGSPSEEADRPPDKSGQSAISEGSATIASVRPEDAVFIANNVEYIAFLENGSSSQAPNGMLEQARKAAERVIKGARVLKR